VNLSGKKIIIICYWRVIIIDMELSNNLCIAVYTGDEPYRQSNAKHLNLKHAVEHSKWAGVWKLFMLRQGPAERSRRLGTNSLHAFQLIFLG
jgi:hypothetical protein